MTQQYLDLEKNVPVHVFPKAQKEVDRYWKWCHIWKGITLVALVSVILANVMGLVGITECADGSDLFSGTCKYGNLYRVSSKIFKKMEKFPA